MNKTFVVNEYQTSWAVETVRYNVVDTHWPVTYSPDFSSWDEAKAWGDKNVEGVMSRYSDTPGLVVPL